MSVETLLLPAKDCFYSCSSPARNQLNLDNINMVLGTGLEPSIASLRDGLPNHLEEPSIISDYIADKPTPITHGQCRRLISRLT